MALKLLLLFIATVIAFWISAICGGGASLILVPMLNLLLPGSVIPFSLTIGTFTSSASRIVVFKKHINWKIVFWFVPFSLPAVLLGAWLMKFVNPLYLQFFVALLLVANVTELFRSKKGTEEKKTTYPRYILALVGFLAGFISGVTGAIGLLFNRFYLRYGLSKEEIVATRAANEIFLHFIKLIIYLLLSLYSKEALWLGITIALGSVVSSYTVKRILPYLTDRLFRFIGYGAMVLSGVFLLISTTQDIIRLDKVSFSRNVYDETTMNWRNSSFVLEFAIDEGLEIERRISPDELPAKLRSQYEQLRPGYDLILLEKVFKAGARPGYELYCYKDNKLTKLNLEE